MSLDSKAPARFDECVFGKLLFILPVSLNIIETLRNIYLQGRRNGVSPAEPFYDNKGF